MSNTDEVRAALKSASGPLTAAELGELAGLPGNDTSKLLYAMVQTGEVEKQDGEGKATYIRNPKFSGKRARNAASSVKPARQVKAAKPIKKANLPTPAPEPRIASVPFTAPPAPVAEADVRNVSLSLATVRGLISFCMSGSRRLDPITRAAVIEATEKAA